MMDGIINSIVFDRVRFGYAGKELLFDDLYLELKTARGSEGHVIALMGASGVGKSSLISLILNAEQPLSGYVAVRPADAIVSYIPQQPVLFGHLTPLENARYFSTSASFKSRFDEQFFQRMVTMLRMEKVLRSARSVHELSVGEAQRLMVARAMSIRPAILIMDEAASGLDADTKLQFLSILREIVSSQKLLAIYCTHNKTEAELIADEVVFIVASPVNGKNVFQQNLADFIAAPPVMEAYKAFNFPVANLLLCCIDDKGMVQLTDSPDPAAFYLCPDATNMTFKSAALLPVSVVRTSAAYGTIRIGNHSMTLPATAMPVGPQFKMNFNGKFLTYGQDFACKGIIEISDNLLIRRDAAV